MMERKEVTRGARGLWLALAWASVSFGLGGCGDDPVVSPADAAADVQGDAADVTPTDTGMMDSGRDVTQPTDATDVTPPTDMVVPVDMVIPADVITSARPDTVTRGTVGSYVRPLDAVPSASGASVFFIAFDTTTEGPAVFRQNMAGMVSVVAQGAPFSAPTSIAISADDTTVFVADPQASGTGTGAIPEDGAILSMSAEGGAVSVIGLGTSVHHPRALAIHGTPAQLTFVATADDGSPNIYRVSAMGGTPTLLSTGPSVLRDPAGLTVADDGTVYVLDARGDNAASGAIFRIVTGGGTPSIVVARGLATGYPAGIALSRDNNRLLAAGRDPGNGPGLLTWMRTDGTMAESPATLGATPGLSFPCGLHRARNADVYAIADDSASDTGAIFTAR